MDLPSYSNLQTDDAITTAVLETLRAAGSQGVDRWTLRHVLSVQTSELDRVLHAMADGPNPSIRWAGIVVKLLA